MRGKYETHVKPKLDLIAQWARDGETLLKSSACPRARSVGIKKSMKS